MGIGSVTSTNSMSSMKMNAAASTDPKIKNIQNEIKDAKQQMQRLSSKEELSASEKADERKKLQKGISRLNTELEQHQEQLRKSQKREIMLAELQEDQELTKEDSQAKEAASDKADEKNLPADEQQSGRQGTVIAQNSDGTVILKEEMNRDEKPGVDTEKKQDGETKKEGKGTDTTTDIGLSRQKTYAIVSADSSVQQANRQGTVIARTRDGIAILKGEMNQDEKRGENIDKKQAELEKMEKKEQRATAFQASILGEANNAMKTATETHVTGEKDRTQVNAENNAFINAMKVSQEDQTQPKFYISFG